MKSKIKTQNEWYIETRERAREIHNHYVGSNKGLEAGVKPIVVSLIEEIEPDEEESIWS